MTMLLAFAPFIVFAVIERLVGSVEGLLAGALVAAALLVRDILGRGHGVKVLDVGTTVLFGSLALIALLAGVEFSIIGTRLCVDAGLLVIVLVSIAIRQPFTLQYARETVPQAVWDTPAFRRTNDIISGVWALAFAVMVAADLVLLYVPDVPPRFGIGATILGLVAAIKFTGWYPDRVRDRAAQPG